MNLFFFFVPARRPRLHQRRCSRRRHHFRPLPRNPIFVPTFDVSKFDTVDVVEELSELSCRIASYCA